MVAKIKWFLVIMYTFVSAGDAFWWSSGSSAKENTPTIKHVPVGYFRAYTYQPFYTGAISNYAVVGTNSHLLQPAIYPMWQQQLHSPIHSPVSDLPVLNPTTNKELTEDYSTTTTERTAQSASSNIEKIDEDTSIETGISPYGARLHQNNLQAQNYKTSGNADAQLASISVTTTQANSQPIANLQQQKIQFVPCMCPLSVNLNEQRSFDKNDDIQQNYDDPN